MNVKRLPVIEEEDVIINEKKIKSKPQTDFSSKQQTKDRESFKCEECDFDFISKPRLNMHIDRNHTARNKEEQFNCTECAFQG